MKSLKERLDIDLEVDPTPPTAEDKKAISAFIKADKLKKSRSKAAQKGTSRPRGKHPRKHPFSEANLSPDR